MEYQENKDYDLYKFYINCRKLKGLTRIQRAQMPKKQRFEVFHISLRSLVEDPIMRENAINTIDDILTQEVLPKGKNIDQALLLQDRATGIVGCSFKSAYDENNDPEKALTIAIGRMYKNIRKTIPMKMTNV